MLGTSVQAQIFIRVAIFALRYFAPLLVGALVLALVFDHNAVQLVHALEALAIAEVGFYVLVYLPQKRAGQKPIAAHMQQPTLTREERRALFAKGMEHVADPEEYLRKWFQGAAPASIRRDNVKEFFCWAFLNQPAWGPDDDAELDEYADKFDELLGRRLAPGRGDARPLRLTLEPVHMQHRPLLWYSMIAAVDTITYGALALSGFTLYRLRASRVLSVFPFRVVPLVFSRRVAAGPTLSYFYAPHTASDRLPVVFVHGVGVGMWAYIAFLRAIRQSGGGGAAPDDGQVGVAAVEMMAVSSRIAGALPDPDALCDEIDAIARRHGWDRFVLVSHSFGSVVAAHALRHAALAPRVASAVFVDPVAFLLHLPDVAWNFTRRAPRLPNEHIISYFAAADPCVAHTLARRFAWARGALWREDLAGRRTTVALGARDVVSPTKAIGRYLADDRRPYERFVAEEDDEASGGGPREWGAAEDPEADRDDAWQRRPWRGEGVDVIWYPRCDHAEIFDSRADYLPIVDVIRSYSAQMD